MLSAVTISLVPEARGGPFVFWNGLADGCAQAAALGFDAVEVFPRDASALEVPQLRSLLDRYRLKLAAVGTGGGWVAHKLTLTQPDSERRDRARAFIRGIIDVAAEFHAPAIIGSMQGRAEGEVTRDQALAWLGEGLSELGNYAEKKNVPLLYEPLNRYETNLHTRLSDAADWIRRLPTRNVRLLADLFHMNIEERELGAALQSAGELLGHVHFADSNRHAIGFGHTDPNEVIAVLRRLGYQGYLSAEILPLPTPEAAARQAIAAFKQTTQVPLSSVPHVKDRAPSP